MEFRIDQSTNKHVKNQLIESEEDSIRAFGAYESEGRMMSQVTVVEREGRGGDGGKESRKRKRLEKS